MPHEITFPQTRAELAPAEPVLKSYLEWAVPRFNEQNGLEIQVDDALVAILSGLGECLPPQGCTALASTHGGGPDGIGMFRRIRPHAVEIKRLFVRTDLRGSGLGKRLIHALLDEARDRGHTDVFLDTAAFMSSAHALYRTIGFSDIAAYPEAEHQPEVSPHVRYMHLALA